MFQAQARWLLLAGLSGSSLFACSDAATPETPNNNAGTAGSGSSGAPSGGSSSGSGGSSSNTAGTMASSGSGGTTSAGAGGSAAGTGGSAAGSGGTAGGSGGSGGGTGGAGGAAPTAVANITGLGANTGKLTGTATFTQGATMTKLVLKLTACPDGVHASHLHEVNDCGNNGEAAMGHWANGEGLGDYTCANGAAMLEKEKPIAMWTVGGDSATDVTKHSFMVHEAGEPTPGGRIGCGVITKQ